MLKGILRKITLTTPTWATIPLRLIMAAVFIKYGSGKVLGAFGGDGWSAWLAQSADVPFRFMRPTWLWLAAAALSEFLGGIMLLLGLFTRVGAFLIACVMITAIAVVELPAFYQFSLLAIAGSLLISGGGMLSLDQLLAGRK